MSLWIDHVLPDDARQQLLRRGESGVRGLAVLVLAGILYLAVILAERWAFG